MSYTKCNDRVPTVDDMYGEYCICNSWLTMDDFFGVYPDVTDEQLRELAERLAAERNAS